MSLKILLVALGAVFADLISPLLLEMYYEVLVVAGIVYALRTARGGITETAYISIACVLTMVYTLENRTTVWQIDSSVVPIIYLASGGLLAIFRPIVAKVAYIVGGLAVLKSVISAAHVIDPQGLYFTHVALNFLSIAQWVAFMVYANEYVQQKLSNDQRSDTTSLLLRVTTTLTSKFRDYRTG